LIGRLLALARGVKQQPADQRRKTTAPKMNRSFLFNLGSGFDDR
jgi:hypothetical protein